MSRISRRRLLAVSSCALLARRSSALETNPGWQDRLEAIRSQQGLPGLGAAIVTPQGCQSLAVTGVRKKGDKAPVTPEDLWHLGSNTKAMTATLAAIAVEEGKLRWDSTLGEVFPRQRDLKKSPLAQATLTHLLSHWSGLPANAPWSTFMARGGRIQAQREAVLELAAQSTDLPPPGQRYEYSNYGYVLAGHMLEEVWKASWEDLMQRRVFAPLGIKNAGFGGVGRPNRLDQPWPHNDKGEPMPQNGPLVDNPAVLGPAGTVHMSLTDWGLFVAEHLAGRLGKGRLLKSPAAYQHLHKATQSGQAYAYGWFDVEDGRVGRILNHSGSNTMNRSLAWLAPEKGFAVIACTNTGTEAANQALGSVIDQLIQAHLKAGA